MKLSDKNRPKKKLIMGVFPGLFWFNCLLAALFTLVSGNVFLGVAVFWPVGLLICIMYTMHEIKFLPVAERREYLAKILADRKIKLKEIKSKKIKR